MVFESIVADLLNKYIGQYVENLDSSQLKLGIWGGNVVLNNLKFKPTTLDDLDLPIRTLYGHFGKLSLQLPWNNLYNAPVIASIEDIYILAVPNSSIAYDPIKDEKWKQDSKNTELKKIEEAKKLKKEIDKKEQVNGTFAEKLVAQIIKNIEVTIKNIHIRYEDNWSTPGKVFAVGVTLDSLEVKTIDSWGEKLSTVNPLNLIFKQLSISCFSVYWNSKPVNVFTNTKSDLQELFKQGIASQDHLPNYQYLLGPINAGAKLRINTKPELDQSNYTIPKFLLFMELETLSVSISKTQYRDVLSLVEALDLMQKAWYYRKYRPNLKSYKGHYKEWWRFAYKCIVEEEVKRRWRNWDWFHISSHRQLCRQYLAAYKEKLTSSKPSDKCLKECQKLEKDIDLFNIILLREQTEMEVEREEKVQEAAQRANRGWLGNWWHGSSKSEDSSDSNLLIKLENAMTPEEKQKLFSAIDYSEGESITPYPKHFVSANLTFVLHTLSIEVLNRDFSVPKILLLELSEVKTNVKQRPSAMSIATTMKLFTITGQKQNTFLPKLVETKTDTTNNANENLLEVLFETNPLDNEDFDKRLRVRSLPLSIIYDSTTINSLVAVFNPEKPINATNIQAAVEIKLTEIKQMSTLGVHHIIEQHDILDLDIELASSSIFIPNDGMFLPNQVPILIISLGTIKVVSKPIDRPKVEVKTLLEEYSAEEVVQSLIERSYDNFELNLTDLQVAFALKDEEYDSRVKPYSEKMFFLKPTNLIVNVKKCIIVDDPRLAKMKVKANLPKVNFTFDEFRLTKLLVLATSIALPQTRVPAVESNMTANFGSCGSISNIPRPKLRQQVQEHKHKTGDVIQFKELEMEFKLNEMSLLVNDSKQVYLDFKMDSLSVEILQQTFDQTIQLQLGCLTLQHTFANKLIDMVTTPKTAGAKDYLFTIKYINVNQTSPEFRMKYGSVLQTIIIDFTQLNLFMHCEALLELISKSNKLVDIMNAKAKPEVKTRHKSVVSFSKRKVSSLTIAQKRMDIAKKQIPKRVDVIFLKLDVTVGKIVLILASKKGKIMGCGVTGGEAGLLLRKTYTHMYAQLNGIEVTNLEKTQKKNIYSKVVSLVDENEALNAKIVIFNNQDSAKTQSDMTVKAHIARLRFIFIQSFVTSVLNFLNNFQTARQALLDASHAAAEAAKQNVQDAYVNATRVELDFVLKAPIIIVPISSTSLSAFVLDLGLLTAENSFIEVKTTQSDENAVLDRLKINLTNLKLSRVRLDINLNYIKEFEVIKPVTFKLTLQRNLSSGWFTEVPDLEIYCKIDSISIILTKDDYATLMRMINENLGESSDHLHHSSSTYSAASPQPIEFEGSSVLNQIAEADEEYLVPEIRTVKSTIKFICNLELVELQLGNPKTENDNRGGLADIILSVISVKGTMLSDSSLQVSLLLLDFNVVDTRESQKNKINRYMQRKDNTDDNSEGSRKSMIDIVYQQEKEAKFANIRISSFILILNVEHLMEIASIFAIDPSQKPKASLIENKIKNSITSDTSEPATILQTFNFKCEYPDIILVENMDSIDTNALIMHCEVQFKARTTGSHQFVSGSINDLQLFSCCYNPDKRNQTKIPVLEPFSVILAGSTPDDRGLHIDLCSTNIKLSVSPGTIQLLTAISSAITGSNKEIESDPSINMDRSDMWNVTKFEDTDYYFLKTVLGEEASNANVSEPPSASVAEPNSEICVFTVPSIIITMESGQGSATTPVLLFESSMKAIIKDWSTLLNIDSHLTLQISYFNNILALWEPLLEPVEVARPDEELKFLPWTLSLSLETNKPGSQNDTLDSTMSTSIDNVDMIKPLMSVNISSKEVMPITITKTCLEVLKQLGDQFSDAIYKPEVGFTGEKPPFVLKNECGLSVIVNLDQSDFKQWPNIDDSETKIKLSHKESLNMACTSNTICKTFSQEKKLSVSYTKYNCDITLPVFKADKRFFPLTPRTKHLDPLGVVSEVVVGNGCTTITLRSIIQMKNHFDVSINIYYMMPKGNEVNLVGTIAPKGKFNLPFEAVYTFTSELFFSVDGYSVSVLPFVWKDLQQSLEKTVLLKCNPKSREDTDPFFIKATGELEQVYYENTERHTMASSCYNIHLRPTAIFKNLLPVDIICIVQGDDLHHELKAGCKLQLPTAEPGSSSIVVRIPNYLDKEWSSKQELKEYDELTAWTFECYESQNKMNMDLGVHTTNAHGTIIIELYCPFWMINKTGLMLTYKQAGDQGTVLYHPENFVGPIMFSFKAKNFFTKKKSQIRVRDGQWSDKFSLDVAGSSGSISCETSDMTYEIGISIHLTYSTLTKQVIFTPLYVIINNWPIELEFTEAGTNNWIKYGAVNVDVQITEGGTYIALFPYEVGMAPALIINHTDTVIDFSEKHAKDKITTLAPNEQVLFTWSQINNENELLFSKGKHVSLREDGVGTFTDSKGGHLYWTSFLYGLQRVMLFTRDKLIAQDAQNVGDQDIPNQEIELVISGIGLSLVDNIARVEVLHMGIRSSGVIWQSRKKNKKRYKQMSERESMEIEAAYQNYLLKKEVNKKLCSEVAVDNRILVDFETFEMIKPVIRQIKRAYKTGLWLHAVSSEHSYQLHAKINRIQIDNQMFDCVFPVVLAPVAPPKSVTSEMVEKPFFEVSILKRINEHSVVQQFKYFKVLVQEFEVKVDIGFVNAIAALFTAEEDYNHQAEIHLSFTLSSGNTGVEGPNMPPVLNILMQSFGVTLTDVQGVIFKLGYFERQYSFLTRRQLTAEVQAHYLGQLVKQLYVLVLGLDVIGNPFGLVLGLGTGAHDFFYEPFQGAIQGPGEFATGLVIGVRSLFGHTVGGAAGAVSKITGAMGKGLAALTFDKEYQRYRREMVSHQPANLQEGLAQSGKGLVMGMVEGVTGLVTKPMAGAKDDGFGGFCKGVGKGLVGFVTRPTAGIVDFASGSFNALKRATDMTEETKRMRAPRCIQPNGLVKPFSRREAEGQKILMSVDKGKYAKTDLYVFHLMIGSAKQKDVLLLTDKRIGYMALNEIFGGYQTVWSYTWNEIQMPVKEVPQGVSISIGKRKGFKSMFQGTDSTTKILLIEHDSHLIKVINEQVKKQSGT